MQMKFYFPPKWSDSVVVVVGIPKTGLVIAHPTVTALYHLLKHDKGKPTLAAFTNLYNRWVQNTKKKYGNRFFVDLDDLYFGKWTNNKRTILNKQGILKFALDHWTKFRFCPGLVCEFSNQCLYLDDPNIFGENNPSQLLHGRELAREYDEESLLYLLESALTSETDLVDFVWFREFN